MGQPIERMNQFRKARWTGGTATDKIDVRGFRGGALQIDAALASETITLQTLLSDGTTWVTVRDASGAAVTVNATSQGMTLIPDALHPLEWIRFTTVGNVTTEVELRLGS